MLALYKTYTTKFFLLVWVANLVLKQKWSSITSRVETPDVITPIHEESTTCLSIKTVSLSTCTVVVAGWLDISREVSALPMDAKANGQKRQKMGKVENSQNPRVSGEYLHPILYAFSPHPYPEAGFSRNKNELEN